jgi:hypothetical protein
VKRAALSLLHGLLRNVRDGGMPLSAVILIDPKSANGADVTADMDHNRSKKEKNMNTNCLTAVFQGDKHPHTKRSTP